MPYRPTKTTYELIRQHPEVAYHIALDLLAQIRKYINPVTEKSFNSPGGVLTTIRTIVGLARGLLAPIADKLTHEQKTEILVRVSEAKMQLEKYKPAEKTIEFARWKRAARELELLLIDIGVRP